MTLSKHMQSAPVKTPWEVRHIKDFPSRVSPDEDSNQIIQAYIKGKQDALQTALKAAVNLFAENLLQAASDVEDVLSFAKEKDIRIKQVLLRTEFLDQFNILGITEPDGYFSDQMLDVYRHSWELYQKTLSSRNLTIRYAFMDESDDIDFSAIEADGYLWHLKLKGKK